MSATAAGADNAMRAQVFSLPELLAGQYQALEAATRAVLPTPAIFALREVILTGCGDSQIAGQLVREAWTRLTGIPCRALTAMQAARFEPELPRARYPHTPLVVAVSSSGDVARTVEAAQQWRQRGALTVALTANPDSRLARAAERCLQITLPPFAAAPGVRSFFLSAAALYLLAVRIGEVRGRFPQAQADHLRTRIPHAADLLARMLPAVEPQLAALARQWRGHRRYELLAGGPARGAAAYGRAKLLEATGVPAIDVDIEEWVHLDYFARDPEACATLVLCPPPARDGGRVRELEPLLQRLGRPYRILTDPALADQFREAIALPAGDDDLLAALPYAAAVALFAAWLSAEQGAENGRGARGRWRDCRDGATTRHSQLLPIKEG